MTRPTAAPRLTDKVVILTGAAGNLGSVMTRHLLREGARVVMTGRTGEKLDAFVEELVAEGYPRDTMLSVVGDASDPEACRRVVAKTVEAWGEIHALVNNAGGAGPKRTLRQIPFSEEDCVVSGESETMFASSMNLLGGPWNMTRATVPHMASQGSIVNVSTIFSRTPYFGRIPYVVPKSGLNPLTVGLARELGAAEGGIRVNTLFPGPIASERIDRVFAAMDDLQGKPSGTTSEAFRGIMTNRRPIADGEAMEYTYPTPDDVARTVVFLASSDSAASSGQSFEVTNGMKVQQQSRAKLVSWPDDRLVDLSRRVVLVLGGEDVDEALVFARRNATRGARVVLAFRSLKAVGHARAQLQGDRPDGRIHLENVDPLVRASVDRLFNFILQRFDRLDGLIVLPNTPNGAHGHTLAVATDADVEGFVEDEIVAPVAFASAMARHLMKWDRLERAPAVTFVTNPDDGHSNRLNQVRRAAVEAMIRVWRDEDAQMVERGEIPWAIEANQLVRFGNKEEENLSFAADWTATLNARVRKMDDINLWIPISIRRSTGKGSMPPSIQRVLPGLHRGRTVVVTRRDRRQPRHRDGDRPLHGPCRCPGPPERPRTAQTRARTGGDHHGASGDRLRNPGGAGPDPGRNRCRGGGRAAAPVRPCHRHLRRRGGLPHQQRRPVRRRGDGRRHDAGGVEPHAERQPDLQLLAHPEVRTRDEGPGRGDHRQRLQLLRW